MSEQAPRMNNYTTFNRFQMNDFLQALEESKGDFHHFSVQGLSLLASQLSSIQMSRFEMVGCNLLASEESCNNWTLHEGAAFSVHTQSVEFFRTFTSTVDFLRCSFLDTKLIDVYFLDSSFSECDLRNTIAKSCNYVKVTFQHCDLSYSEWLNTCFYETKFNSCAITQTKFIGCKFIGVDFRQFENIELNLFENCTFHNCDLKISQVDYLRNGNAILAVLKANSVQVTPQAPSEHKNAPKNTDGEGTNTPTPKAPGPMQSRFSSLEYRSEKT